jgi:CRP-like cAMP-binding protein
MMQSIKIEGPGCSFGEKAITDGKGLRTATITALQDCTMAIIDKANYNRILKDINERELLNTERLLQSFWIFNGFTKTKLKQIAKSINEKKFCRGEVIYKEGDPIDGVYMVKQGEFEVT